MIIHRLTHRSVSSYLQWKSVSVQDATSLDKIPMFVQFCTPVLMFMPVAQPTTTTSSPLVKGVCSCAIDLTHFTTFVLVDVIVDDMLQQKNTPATVLVFLVFLPLHPTAFDENTRASFVLAVASVYSMSISNVQLLAVDLWPLDDMTSTTATSVSSARGTAGNNIPTTPKRRSLLTGHQSRLTVRISGTPAFTKKSTAALHVQLIKQGLPTSLSGIVPKKTTNTDAFPRQFILLGCVALLLMCCASCCTMCYLFTENLQTSFQFPQGVYFRANVLVFPDSWSLSHLGYLYPGTTPNRSRNLYYDSWSLSHLGYLYPGTTPVMIKLDYNRSCPWV